MGAAPRLREYPRLCETLVRPAQTSFACGYKSYEAEDHAGKSDQNGEKVIVMDLVMQDIAVKANGEEADHKDGKDPS